MLKEQAEWTAALLCTPGGLSGMCFGPDDLKVQLSLLLIPFLFAVIWACLQRSEIEPRIMQQEKKTEDKTHAWMGLISQGIC